MRPVMILNLLAGELTWSTVAHAGGGELQDVQPDLNRAGNADPVSGTAVSGHVEVSVDRTWWFQGEVWNGSSGKGSR